MTNSFIYLVNRFFCCMMVLVLFIFLLSCGQESSKKDPAVEFTAYCIRECVLETGGSEMCDGKCDCVSQELSREYSQADLSDLVQNISKNNENSINYVQKYKEVLESCSN